MPRLLERAMWVADTLREQILLQRQMGVRPSDVVLDVGSGGSPNPRSNVLCDKFIDDATERHGQPVRADRPLVVGDVERLPFADKAFDFVICSHLLEHVADPARAIAELERVAPRGYIETPEASWEKLVGYPFHRWLVTVRDGVLRFEGKPAPAWDPELSAWFQAMLRTLSIERRVWFARRRIGVLASLRWEGRIPFEIVRPLAPETAFAGAGSGDGSDGGHGHGGASPGASGIASRAIEAIGRRLRRTSDLRPEDLARRLRCPDCRGTLASLGRQAGHRCTACGGEFPSDAAGRAVLLPRAVSTAASSV